MRELSLPLSVPIAAREQAGMLPVVAKGLIWSSDGKRLIDNLDISFEGHGISAIMGPNGAGKSLLVRLLHGMIAPDAGGITYAGLPLDDSVRARQAMMFQSPVLLRRSVIANIGFVLSLRGQRDPIRAEAILEEAGLLAQARQPARLLSGGEQQRLALARALATEPRLLFLDEPTASLDPASMLRIEQVLRQASQRGVKIILVTHDIGQARRLAEDIAFVHRGRVIEHGAAADVIERPESAEAKAFFSHHLVL